MISHRTLIRVRYRDTDQMGVVYHGVYLEYFETGRTELLRALGMAYSSIESEGLMLPVLNLSMELKRPARYDDLVQVDAIIRQMPNARLTIDYILSRDSELLATGHTTHAFVSAQQMKPVRPPASFLSLLEQSMSHQAFSTIEETS